MDVFDLDAPDLPEDEEGQVASAVVLDDTDADELLGEAERRHRLGGYYRELMRADVFNDGSEEANVVAREVRQFARTRMAELLGVRAVEPSAVIKAELPFTGDQIDALKLLADRVLKRPSLVAPPPTPTIQKVAAPGRPEAKPPAPRQPQQEKVPARRPPAAQPQPKQQAARPAGQKRKRPEDVPDGEPFKIGHKVWMWETKLGSDGHPIINPDTRKPWRFKKDLTPRVPNPNATPMPTGAALENATAALADRSSIQSAQVFDKKTQSINKDPDSIIKADGTITHMRPEDPING